MRFAFNSSKNSTCIRMSVGAVIYGEDQRVVGAGWNGIPDGCVQCASKGCNRIQNNIPSGTQAETCRGLHAEQRALLDACGYAVNATIYCTHHPCSICTKLIIAAGVREVVYSVDYPDDLAKELFMEAGVIVRQYDPVD